MKKFFIKIVCFSAFCSTALWAYETHAQEFQGATFECENCYLEESNETDIFETVLMSHIEKQGVSLEGALIRFEGLATAGPSDDGLVFITFVDFVLVTAEGEYYEGVAAREGVLAYTKKVPLAIVAVNRAFAEKT